MLPQSEVPILSFNRDFTCPKSTRLFGGPLELLNQYASPNNDATLDGPEIPAKSLTLVFSGSYN